MYDVQSVRVNAEGCANKASRECCLFFLFWFTQVQTLAAMALLVLLCLLGHVCNLQVSAAPVNTAFKHLQSARKCFRVPSAVTGTSCLLKLALCVSRAHTLHAFAFAALFWLF